MTTLHTSLKNEYERIFSIESNRPSWAVKRIDKPDEIVHPGIPFIGKNFYKKKILLYASAENLVNYKGHLDDKETAIDRNHYFYEKHKHDGRFFPHVHITPVTNGALLIATAYILSKLENGFNYSNPFELIEHMAIGNFGKFSIAGSSNKDYAGNVEKLKYSFEYVRKDLEILKPQILILPKKIYNHKEIKETIQSIIPNSLILPINQINTRVINIHLSKQYTKKPDIEIGNLAIWQSNLGKGFTGKSNTNFSYVYSYLDKVLEKYANQ